MNKRNMMGVFIMYDIDFFRIKYHDYKQKDLKQNNHIFN